jgi:hypothetical protein
LLSELAIVAGLAKASLPENPKVKWDDWVGDYGLVRDLIAETYPDEFHDFMTSTRACLRREDSTGATPPENGSRRPRAATPSSRRPRL